MGDSLTEVMRRRQEQQQHEETLQFQREQESRKSKHQEEYDKYLRSVEERKERLGEIEFNQKQQDRNAARMERARHAATPQEAAAIAADTRTYDPHTGKETGRGQLTAGPLQNVGPAPTQPVEPALPTPAEAIPDIVQAIPGMPPEIAARMRGKTRPQPEEGAMVGPIPSAEETRNAEMQRAGTVDAISGGDGGRQAPSEEDLKAAEATRAGQEEKLRRYEQQYEAYQHEEPPAPIAEYGEKKAAYEGELKSFPQRQAAHAAEERGAERRRPYTLSMGGNDPGVTFDFETQRHAASKDAADRWLESLASVPMSEQDRGAAMQIHAAIESGAIDPTKAGVAFQKERMGMTAEAGRDSRAAAGNATRVKVAEINSRKPGLVLSERRFNASQDKDIRKETRKDITDWLKASGLEAAPKQRALTDLALRQLQGNGKEQQAALVAMGRATQGDNRFSDKDYKVFVQNGGVGVLDSAANTVGKLIDGEYGDQTITVATQMATALKAVYNQRLVDAAADGRQEFVHNDIYDPQVAESVLEQRLGKDVFQRESNRGGQTLGGPPEISARRKGKAGKSTTVKASGSAVDDILNKYAPAHQQ